MLRRAVAALARSVAAFPRRDPPPPPRRDLAAHATELGRDLVERVLPYWYDTAQDREHGGYLLADALGGGGGAARAKLVVSQARLVWGFSHAALHGLGGGERDYVAAAEHGVRFLLRYFRDPVGGGYFWRTAPDGSLVSDLKLLYGQAFVVYALVEYARASGEAGPLRHALELYELLEEHAHDDAHGGWLEHFHADWTPVVDRSTPLELDVAGLKGGNAHLHVMEALAELYAETRDERVRRSLSEAVSINATRFFPPQPAASASHLERDWTPAAEGRRELSYGHNVEFAWLMVRAERVLGRSPSWAHFYAHLDHALEHGFDHDRGGLYELGVGNEPASHTDKVWWPQAELVAALTVALEHRDDARYRAALARLLDFVRARMTDERDGVWIEAVTAAGAVRKGAKAHVWKANYHDVRALVLFTEAFGP